MGGIWWSYFRAIVKGLGFQLAFYVEKLSEFLDYIKYTAV